MHLTIQSTCPEVLTQAVRIQGDAQALCSLWGSEANISHHYCGLCTGRGQLRAVGFGVFFFFLPLCTACVISVP